MRRNLVLMVFLGTGWALVSPAVELGVFLPWGFALAAPPAPVAPPAEVKVRPGAWAEHHIRQGDGKGGWIKRPAKRLVLKQHDSKYTMPFGLVRMDNGEIALICSWEKGDGWQRPIIAFSKDGGNTWTDFRVIPGVMGRPQFLTSLGGGRLSFVTEAKKARRYFSNDYGRTWPESLEHPPTSRGQGFGLEGNAWVDRDRAGRARTILEIGWHYQPGKRHPVDDATGVFRRSMDGGKTWIDEVAPPQWQFTVQHKGKKWRRGVSEGSILRAANGDLVAALRTDIPPLFLDGPNDDSLEGTAISISSDDGKTWSKMQFLFHAGRHHANLQRLPGGALVSTLIVRDDIRDSKLASQGRGCEALISHDHGRTWNLERRFQLDRFDYLRKDGYWVDGQCGHIAAVVLDDGQMISVYGQYLLGAAVLIKWKPESGPVRPALSSPVTHSDWMGQDRAPAWGAQGVRQILDRARQCGWRKVYWRCLDGGRALYPSKVLQPLFGVDQDNIHRGRPTQKYLERINRLDWGGFDALQEAITYGHRLGLEVHAWLSINEDDHGWGWTSRYTRQHPESRWLRPDGRPFRSQQSFAFLEVRQYKLDIVKEILAYRPDGIFFDWIRTGDVRDNPHTDADGVAIHGYERPNVQRFRQQFALDPHKVPNGDDRWVQVRAEPQTAFMRAARRLIRQHHPPCLVSALVQHRFGYRGAPRDTPYDGNLRGLLVDLKTWAREGLIDQVVPAGYYRPGGNAEKAYRQLQQETAGKVEVLVFGWLRHDDFASSVQLAEKLGAREVLLWESDYVGLPPANETFVRTMRDYADGK